MDAHRYKSARINVPALSLRQPISDPVFWILVWSLLLAVALGTVNVQSVLAQDPPLLIEGSEPTDILIQQLRVQVMPEFDDHRVLVIIQGRLDVSETTLPAPITFRIPQGAQINQMATIDVDSGVTKPQPFEVEADPDDKRWTLVTYSLDNAHFFYEYYYNPIVGQTDKQFDFTFSSPQPVVDLTLEIQQPLAATDFTVDPLPTNTRFDDIIGFTYHHFTIGDIEAGAENTIKVNYIKTDPSPSVSREKIMGMEQKNPHLEAPSADESASASSPAPIPDLWPIWIFVLLGFLISLIIIGGGAWFRVQTNASQPAPVQAKGLNLFCVRCGAKLRQNAHFCHACGTPHRERHNALTGSVREE